jgi:hypothetical protein
MKFSNLTRVVLALSLLALFPTCANAYVCLPEQGRIDKIGDFLPALVDTLSDSKSARDLIVRTARMSGEPNWPADMMYAFIQAQQYYGCGISRISNYKNSSNKDIAMSATGIEEALNRLRDITAVAAEELKTLLNGDTAVLGAGARAEKDAIRSSAAHEAWEILLMSVTASTYAAIGTPESEHRLTLTAKERASVIRKLEKLLGKPAKAPEEHILEVASSNLLKFLKDKWRPASN